jgi:hypothetical protein
MAGNTVSTVLALQDFHFNLLFSRISWGLAFAALFIVILFKGDSNKGSLIGWAVAIIVALALLAGMGLNLNFTS